MVTVTDYQVRLTTEGKKFFVLMLEGGLEMIQSQDSGRFYATVRKCSISSSFNEETAKRMIGQTIPGRIGRVACEGYEYTLPESGTVISLAHRWEYQPEEERIPFSRPLIQAMQEFS